MNQLKEKLFHRNEEEKKMPAKLSKFCPPILRLQDIDIARLIQSVDLSEFYQSCQQNHTKRDGWLKLQKISLMTHSYTPSPEILDLTTYAEYPDAIKAEPTGKRNRIIDN
ncbi:hypothetical protein P5673_004473 [Acropora cervicornis]|uniref:Uncharacterized protein n=1 Tax=Acropora cervicornis TaxID=6130 RepID=A0AAD9R0A3_ACRCE|nr:hypothetical protein P5673_004473 [Acropora cervicornis]